MEETALGASRGPSDESVPLISPTFAVRSRQTGLYHSVERLEPPHVEEGERFSVHAPAEPCDEQGWAPKPQILKYNARHVSSVLSLVQLDGTVFASWMLWVHVLGNVAAAILVALIVFLCSRQPELIDTNRLSELVSYSSKIVAFLLVLHLIVAIRRWWAMRLDTLGGLWCAASDLMMILAAHLPHPCHKEMKSLVLRYCLASLELTFMQAQGTDGVLGGLVQQELLYDDEKRKLEELVSKPQAVWVWIAGIFQQLAERGRLSSRLLMALYDICAKARASVGRGQGAFSYLDTQLPFSYAHLLSVLVHLNNFAIAAKCGAVSAVAMWNITRSEERTPVSDAENFQVFLLQILLVVGGPLIYHAILIQAAVLADPFGDRFQDFPRRACHAWLRDECEELQLAGERLPMGALRAVDDFRIQDGDLVRDCVVVAC